ncbi:MAG: D-alanyl-D-alanine carboxypeptidase [Candidatus Moranbacteria bacterium]|nr:D-alanyl-D-alanine carboxypeptidase [Candidatus Moranbacteria bacterium]
MRKFFLWIILLGVVAGALSWNSDIFLAHGEDVFGFFDNKIKRFSEDDTESQTRIVPYVSNEHTFSTGFQPELKPYAPHLSIPTAHAAIILDADSGKVLYERNADTQRQIASLTKLFTATIVVERVDNLDELVTIDEETIYTEGTRIGCPRSGFCNSERLKIGEKISVKNLLKAALMNSANDAALALGKHIGKTEEGFVKIMNERTKELGLQNTHFCTPSGLEPDGREHECYSSARDVATLTAHALQYPVLWDIMRMEKMFISSADNVYEHEIFNTNELLGQWPNLLGTKTGFTPLAGYSLLAVASSDSHESHKVIAVLLNDPYRWQSIRSMFDWSFQAVEWK